MKDEEQELKIAYLQMIQAVIDRMSTLSAVIKGFCVTTVSGIIIASFTDVNRCGPFLALVLVFSFIILDVYYLQFLTKDVLPCPIIRVCSELRPCKSATGLLSKRPRMGAMRARFSLVP